MRSRFHDEQGAVAVVVAICLVLLFTFAALAVDLGLWLTERRQLQSAADAAALAGCRELAAGEGDTVIWSAVEDYAARNFTVPVDSADSEVLPPNAGGLSDIGDDYVKVTVRTSAPSFFARVMGYDNGLVEAQSVASIGYLAGARSPVPWGLSVLKVNEMNATLGGQTISLWDVGGDRWAGTFPAGLSGSVTLRATNTSNYEEVFDDLLSVGNLPSTGPFKEIDLEKTTFTSGVDSTCWIAVSLNTSVAPTAKVTAACGSSKTTLVYEPATERFVGTMAVPGTSDDRISVPVTVELVDGSSKTSVDCRILVRRANYILEDVEVEPIFAGPTDSVGITVETLDFDYGVAYQLKVEGGAGESGNFLALDFASSSLDHSLCGFPATPVYPGGHGGSDYSEDIVGDPTIIVHVNDIVHTMTGNMVGPTRSGLEQRFAGTSLISFSAWEAAGKPETPQIFLVPITEKIEDIEGKSELKIISFATFFCEQPPQGSQDCVVGRFIEYTAPGLVVVNHPPGPLAIKAVHLVSDHLDF